jgi:fused signal recognition particle receptor
VSETVGETGAGERKGWLARLRAGLARSSRRLGDGIVGIFRRGRVDAEALEQLEELLIAADLGPHTAATLAGKLAEQRFEAGVTPEAVRDALAQQIADMVAPVATPLAPDPAHRPHVVLVVGVNGSGKTTTIGKLAKQLRAAGQSVMLAAGDTFRAAAVEQLKVWGERSGCPVIAGAEGTDPAAIAYTAHEAARAQGVDVLLVDTAGRLHNKANLMAQLQKVVRVLGKQDETAPHDCVLVLDATTGQNAHSQVETFREMVQVSGLILTKLDGSARGGVLVALAERFGLPVHAIGVGEGADDLRPFQPRDFADSLLGIDA